jgi:nucleotide-binding universal stress UspA family protein
LLENDSVVVPTRGENIAVSKDPNEEIAPGPVLVGIDFSEDSKAALVWAARYAKLAGLALAVLHVVHDPAERPGFYSKKKESQIRPMSDVAKEMLDEFMAKMAAEHPDLPQLAQADTQLVRGLPPGRIVEVAEEIGAQLIVVGSRGRTALQSILLGSVAERVVQLSGVPTVVIKASQHGGAA